jgi:predicted aldo/keto reductase-like oxidoreductase
MIQQAEEQGMGIVLMRPLTGGVFRRLMAQTFPQIDVLDEGCLLLHYVLSDPYVDVVLVGGHGTWFVELNNEILDDVTVCIDGRKAHLSGAARSLCEVEGEWLQAHTTECACTRRFAVGRQLVGLITRRLLVP